VKAIDSPGSGFCNACLKLVITVNRSVDFTKDVLERPWNRHKTLKKKATRCLRGKNPHHHLRGIRVDIEAADESIQRIKEHVRSTFRSEVIGDIGDSVGCSLLIPSVIRIQFWLVGTDGVGRRRKSRN